MDQLFPFWFNSPCDWFSVRPCWKISAIKRAWNRGGTIWIQMPEARGLVAAKHSEPGDNCRLIMCYWQKLQLLCMRPRYLHLNAYCRNLNGIKADCKCQLLGLKKNSITKMGMEMRELFSNRLAEINKKEIAALGFFFYGVCLYSGVWIYLQWSVCFI